MSARPNRPAWRSPAWLSVPLVIGLLVSATYPFVMLLGLSVSRSTLGRLFIKWPIETNYFGLLNNRAFLSSLARTVAFALPVSALEMVLGVAVALVLQSRARARWVIGLILLPLMTPPMMVATAWKLMLAPAGGLLDGALLGIGVIDRPISFLGTMPWAFGSVAIADVWQWTPFIVILSYAALQTIPDDVIEAARMDGATPWTTLWFVRLPMIAPTLVAIYILRVVMAFKLFDLVYGLTFGGPAFSTTVASFTIWRTALQQFDLGQASAQTMLFIICITLVTLPLTWLHRRSEAFLR